jgi:hypothetical protein
MVLSCNSLAIGLCNAYVIKQPHWSEEEILSSPCLIQHRSRGSYLRQSHATLNLDLFRGEGISSSMTHSCHVCIYVEEHSHSQQYIAYTRSAQSDFSCTKSPHTHTDKISSLSFPRQTADQTTELHIHTKMT